MITVTDLLNAVGAKYFLRDYVESSNSCFVTIGFTAKNLKSMFWGGAMVIVDYFKGPAHKENAARLEAELLTLIGKSELERQTFQSKHESLEAELLALKGTSEVEKQTLRSKQESLEADLLVLKGKSAAEIQMLHSKHESLKAELLSLKRESDAEKQMLQSKYESLERKAIECGLMDLLAIQQRIRGEEENLLKAQAPVAEVASRLENSQAELLAVRQQILGAEEIVLLESFAIYEPKFQLTNSSEYKIRLDEIRTVQKERAKRLSAVVDSWENDEVFLSKAQWKKLRKDALKLALRSFNSESDYCVDNVKFNNVDKMVDRIRRSFETCNKLLKSIDAWWADVGLDLKLEELHLAHEYQLTRQEEKEAARQARENLRQQEKLENEIKEARAKIEKERQHFSAALEKLKERLFEATANQVREGLLARIEELKGQSSQLDEEEKLLDYREKNARAGYVYVISNMGAFGAGVYKIGMTRRLEPQDRVDELGDASVPFRFDVHALVFSDNAPTLEAKLHTHFAAGRINKVNGRKEFF